jgi:flavin-dependent dehydrogenase
MGNALVARLLYDIRRAGVDLRYKTEMKRLVRLGDEIVGAVFVSSTGEIAIRARKGVILATGGIGWNRELRERFLPEAARDYSLAPSSNTGDGILEAERVHAAIESDLESPALWMPCSVMPQPEGEKSVFPHIMLDRAKPGLLAVDRGRSTLCERSRFLP